MLRVEIDSILRAKLKEVGLRNYQIGWQWNPAELHVLVEGEIKREPISTRITKSQLERLCARLESYARRPIKWRGKAGIKAVEAAQ